MSELLNENIHIEKTSLFDFHNQMNAKLVPFGGYYLPINYTPGIIAEHNHTRSSASIFDVSHMGQIEISGPFVMEAMEKILPISFSKISPGKVKYTQFLNKEGKIIDDLMIHRTSNENTVWLVVNAACKEKDINHLRENLNKKFDINIRDDLSLIALQGPKSESALLKLAPGILGMEFMSSAWVNFQNYKILISRCGYTGEDGFEISVPNDAALMLSEKLLDFPYVKLAGLGARDLLRLEAGLCLYGQDLDTTTTPVEAGLIWSISKRRRAVGGFPGANIIKSQLLNGTSRMLIGIRPSGRAPARLGTNIKSVDGMSIGIITSGAFGPTIGGPVSIGYVITSHAKVGMEINLDIRGKNAPAKVVALPFFPHRYFKNTHQ